MNNAQKMELVRQVFNLIFNGKGVITPENWVNTPIPAGFQSVVTGWNPRTFVNGSLRGVDFDVNDNGRILNLRMLEQNPNKRDGNGNLKQTALRAQRGECLAWLIDRKKQTGGFLGSMQNGQWVPSKDVAYTQTQPVQTAAGAQGGVNPQNVQNIPYGTTIPDHVIQTAGGGTYTMTPEEAAQADAIAEQAMNGGVVVDPDMIDMSAYDDEVIDDYGYDYDDPYQ